MNLENTLKLTDSIEAYLNSNSVIIDFGKTTKNNFSQPFFDSLLRFEKMKLSAFFIVLSLGQGSTESWIRTKDVSE